MADRGGIPRHLPEQQQVESLGYEPTLMWGLVRICTPYCTVYMVFNGFTCIVPTGLSRRTGSCEKLRHGVGFLPRQKKKKRAALLLLGRSMLIRLRKKCVFWALHNKQKKRGSF